MNLYKKIKKRDATFIYLYAPKRFYIVFVLNNITRAQSGKQISNKFRPEKQEKKAASRFPRVLIKRVEKNTHFN